MRWVMYPSCLFRKVWLLILLLPTLSVYAQNGYIARGERGGEFHSEGEFHHEGSYNHGGENYNHEGTYNKNVNRQGNYNRGGEYSPNTYHGEGYGTGGAAARGYAHGYENGENNSNDQPVYVEPLMPGEEYQTQPDNSNQPPYL